MAEVNVETANEPIIPTEPVSADPMQMEQIDKELDLTGDGGVIKKIIVQGEGWERPSEPADVSVHYTGTLLDGTVFDSSVGKEPFSFKLGAHQVIKGWEEAVSSMKKRKSPLYLKTRLCLW